MPLWVFFQSLYVFFSRDAFYYAPIQLSSKMVNHPDVSSSSCFICLHTILGALWSTAFDNVTQIWGFGSHFILKEKADERFIFSGVFYGGVYRRRPLLWHARHAKQTSEPLLKLWLWMPFFQNTWHFFFNQLLRRNGPVGPAGDCERLLLAACHLRALINRAVATE